jgi:hypothetical protein
MCLLHKRCSSPAGGDGKGSSGLQSAGRNKKDAPLAFGFGDRAAQVSYLGCVGALPTVLEQDCLYPGQVERCVVGYLLKE